MSDRCGRLINQLNSSSNTVDVKNMKHPAVVCITGAAGNIAYALAFQVATGRMLGMDQPIELRLLDLPSMIDKVKGVMMELEDCAFPLVSRMVATGDYAVAFKDCDVALLVGAKPRGPGMQRADLLRENAQIFAGQGKALNSFAKRSVKVCVVGNPANTNALIASTNAPDISPKNFSCLTRLDMNRAISQASLKIGVPVTDVKNIIIWGNHSKTQYPDVSHALVTFNGHTLPLRSVINDDAWIQSSFIPCVQDRGAAIIAVRKLSSAASAACAVVDHIHDWILGTPNDTFVSMGVMSDGSYGIPKGIIYSFPVRCRNGEYHIVQGLPIDSFSRLRMTETANELLSERKDALGK